MSRTVQLKTGTAYSILDSVCALLLVLCPFLQHYQGIMVDSRATVLLILAPYLMLRLWQNNRVMWTPLIPLVLYSVCKILDNGTGVAELGREGLMCLVFLAAISGVIDFKAFTRAWITVAVIGSVLIMAQYVCYYLLDFHLQLVPTQLFLEGSDQWMGLAETGKISILGNPTTMYRPSSIFMEPSHMALYCVPAQLMLLFSPGVNWRRFALAAVLTAGVLASTSGLGIVLCMGLWFIYLAIFCGEGMENKPILFIKGFTIPQREFKGISIRKKRYGAFTFRGITVRPINIVLVGSLFLAAVLMYIFVDVFRDSINRILFSQDGYNAVSGRTSSGIFALTKMQGSEWLWGKAVEGSEANGYMSGLFESIYKYGLVGAAISYTFYVISLFKLKRQYSWFALLMLGLSCFTNHTHGSAYMMIFCIYLLSGYVECGVQDPRDLSLRIHPLGLYRKKEEVNE